ncbi:MAG: alpha/beta fold hydrolase [Paracoccaceae bacterium]
MLLLHGWSQSSAVFARQFAGELTRRYRLIVPDLRGHGASDKPPAPEGYADGRGIAGDVAALIGALDLGPPVVVGWSMGGWAVGDAIRAHGPGLFHAVVTTGSVARAGAADPERMARRKPDVRAEGMFDPDPAVQAEAAIAFARAMTAAPLSKRDLAFLVAQMMACPPEIRRAARARDADWRGDLARVEGPSLVIHGAADRVCFADQAEETAGALGAEFVTLAGAGHLPFWERPAEFDAALGAFLDAL